MIGFASHHVAPRSSLERRLSYFRLPPAARQRRTKRHQCAPVRSRNADFTQGIASLAAFSIRAGAARSMTIRERPARRLQTDRPRSGPRVPDQKPTASCRRTSENAAWPAADLRIELEIDFRQIDNHPHRVGENEGLCLNRRRKIENELGRVANQVGVNGGNDWNSLCLGRDPELGLIGGCGRRRPTTSRTSGKGLPEGKSRNQQ